MRGQIGLEQIVTIIVFISIVGYVFFRVFSYEPLFISNIERENLLSYAYQVSEILLKDPGYPTNWDEEYVLNGIESVKRIGLVEESLNKSNLLSFEKMGNLSEICTANYNYLKKIFGNNDITIIFLDERGNYIFDACKPPRLPPSNSINITRIFSYKIGNQRMIGKMIIGVWET
ncbi:MAG: hypothetical protein J7L39_04160 [Candidatus Aenigmarchaeota archaeon]|nr:hypothetical protein [Candidatus Aenigmarchaeota archaeon]